MTINIPDIVILSDWGFCLHEKPRHSQEACVSEKLFSMHSKVKHFGSFQKLTQQEECID